MSENRSTIHQDGGPGDGSAKAELLARGEALNSIFYAPEDDPALIEHLRLRLQEEAAAEDIKSATGILDPDVPIRLARLGIRPDTLAAMTLFPLVQVAWADGVIEPKERDATLAAAVETGLRRGGPSHELLRIWLQDRPPPDLERAWRAFVLGLLEVIDPSEAERLCQNITEHSRAVAKAAGDLLGHGSMVSPEEESVLRELEATFRGR